MSRGEGKTGSLVLDLEGVLSVHVGCWRGL